MEVSPIEVFACVGCGAPMEYPPVKGHFVPCVCGNIKAIQARVRKRIEQRMDELDMLGGWAP